jgi:hypothetical protein
VKEKRRKKKVGGVSGLGKLISPRFSEKMNDYKVGS